MAETASPRDSGVAFDDFLYAPVDGSLSVLSALARLNLDPWKEAAALARLSKSAAEARLASLLASLPDLDQDSKANATRLIALLPRFPDLARPIEGVRSRMVFAARYPQMAIYGLLTVIVLLVGFRYLTGI